MTEKGLLFGIWMNSLFIMISVGAIARKLGCDWRFVLNLLTGS